MACVEPKVVALKAYVDIIVIIYILYKLKENTIRHVTKLQYFVFLPFHV